jgi:hypothetical protein
MFKYLGFIQVFRGTAFHNNCCSCVLYLHMDRYMFRPLSAIIKRNSNEVTPLTTDPLCVVQIVLYTLLAIAVVLTETGLRGV